MLVRCGWRCVCVFFLPQHFSAEGLGTRASRWAPLWWWCFAVLAGAFAPQPTPLVRGVPRWADGGRCCSIPWFCWFWPGWAGCAHAVAVRGQGCGMLFQLGGGGQRGRRRLSRHAGVPRLVVVVVPWRWPQTVVRPTLCWWHTGVLYNIGQGVPFVGWAGCFACRSRLNIQCENWRF